MIHTRQELFSNDTIPPTGKARSGSISLYQNHRHHLALRERELGIHKSILIQLLLEIDERTGILRAELLRRIPPTSATPAVPAASITTSKGGAK